MDNEERDKCLTDIQIKIAGMSSDIRWLKRVMTAAAVLICACLGVSVPEIFIQG